MNKFLEKLLRPQPKQPISQKDYEAKYQRNIFQFFSIQLINILSIFLYIFSNTNSNLHLFHTLSAISINVVYCLSVRSNFWIFRIWYTLNLTFYAPIASIYDQGLHFGFMGIVMCPLFVLATTERQIHAGLSLIFGLVYFHYFMTKRIAQELKGCFSEEDIDNFSIALIFFILIMYILIGFFNYNHRMALKKLAEAKVIEDAYSHQNSFLLSLSHELRNPLNAMIGSIQLALFDNLSKETKENLENAQIGGEILLQFINNMLDGGKIDSGGLEIREDSTNIVKLVERVWTITSRLIKNKGLTGSVYISKKLPKFLATDSYRITQILLNLVGNAVKFTQNGKVTVKIDWISGVSQVTDKSFEPVPYSDDDQDEGIFERDYNIFLHHSSIYDILALQKGTIQRETTPIFNSNNGILKITVSDTGCGISEEDIPKLFKKFSQVNKEASQRQIGTGLGLYITKEICKKMNGDLRVFSKPGVGSVFIVCLSKKITNSTNDSSGNVQASPAFNPRLLSSTHLRAMIVDDDLFNRKIISSFFKKTGLHDINLASDGLEAFQFFQREIIKNKYIKFISMDYDMPIMNGKEAVVKIREFEDSLNLQPSTVMMISGHCSGHIIEECLDKKGKVRANYFLKKPVSYEQIFDIVRKHCHEKFD